MRTLSLCMHTCIQVYRAQESARRGAADGSRWCPKGPPYGSIWLYPQVVTAIANILLYAIMRTPLLTTLVHMDPIWPQMGPHVDHLETPQEEHLCTLHLYTGVQEHMVSPYGSPDGVCMH